MSGTTPSAARTTALLLLALAALMWASNWVTGRALRDAFQPVMLNFIRWLVASLVLAPFCWHRLRGKGAVLRRDAGILLLLSLLGVAIFQCFVYVGLRTTETVNAVLLNSSMPLFMMLCAWFIEGERASPRQVAGMLVSFLGIVVIVLRGEPARLAQFEFHAGDAWILVAMPVWGVYSVLLKRRPAELDGMGFLFVIALAGTAMLLPAMLLEALHKPSRLPTAGEAGAAIYLGIAASVVAFWAWNKGVALVGPNTAGFMLHLLPLFGTALAMVFLGERFHAFHAVGFATILAGVILATRAPAPASSPRPRA